MNEQLYLGVASAALIVPFSAAVVRWPQLGLAAISIVIAASWEVPTWPPIGTVYGLSVSLPDVLCGVLFLASIIMPRPTGSTSGLAPSFKIAFQLFVALFGLSVVRGVVANGLASALNEARPWLYILAISFWTARLLAVSPNGRRWLQNWILATGALVLMVAIINIFRYGLGGASTSVRSVQGDILEAGRPVASGQALILAACAILALFLWHGHGNALHLVLGVACGAAVVVVQHRSVWIAFACAAVVAVMSLGSGKRMTVALLGIAGLLAVSQAAHLGLLGRLPELLARSATDSATYQGRVYDWVVLVERSLESGPQALLLGMPSGSGWWRYREDGLRIGYVPHNWYVATYLRVGVLGLMSALAAATVSVAHLYARHRHAPYLSLVVLILIYGWAYNLQWYLAPLLAFALCGAFPNGADGNPRTRHVRSRRIGSSHPKSVPGAAEAHS